MHAEEHRPPGDIHNTPGSQATGLIGNGANFLVVQGA